MTIPTLLTNDLISVGKTMRPRATITTERPSDRSGLVSSVASAGRCAVTAILLLLWLIGSSPAVSAPFEVHYNANLAFGAQSLFTVELAGIGIGPPTEYDRLIVDGQVSVGGTLELVLIDGFDQSITNDDVFAVMETTGGILGQWANVANGQRLNVTGGNGSFLVEYGLGSSQPNNLFLSSFQGPMTATWLGGNDAWFNAAKWDINQVPTNQGHDFFNVVINSGTVTVASDVTIAGLTNTSIINGGGNLTVDTLNYSAGIISGSGSLVLKQGGVIDNPGSSLNLSRLLINQGELTWGRTRLFGNGSGSMQNDAGGTLILTGGGGTIGSGPNLGPDIVNDGTLRMIGVDAGDVFDHERPLTNSATGVVDIQGGTLSLEGGGTLAGTVQVASGAVLKLSSPSGRPLSIATDISGGGTTILESGYAYFDDPAGTTVGNLQMNTQGHLSGSGRVTVEDLTWSMSASMQGSGTTTVTGNLTLDRINNPLNRRLNVQGVLDWQGGNLFGSGTLHVQPGAVAHLITSGRATQTATTIINDGTILVDDPTAAEPDFDLGNTFINNGLIQIEEGTLRIDGIVTNGGDIQVNGGTLIFAGESTGSITGGDVFLDGSSTRIDGVYDVRTTTISTGHGVRFDAPAATDTLNLPGGVIQGSGPITAGTFNWTAGSLQNTIVVTGSATINMTSAQFNGGHVDNRGTLDWQRGGMGAGGTITNRPGAQMQITGTANRATPSIVNQGTLTKRDAAVVTVDTSFDGSGTTIVDAGTLILRNAVVQHVGTTLTDGVWEVQDGATLVFSQSGAVDIRTNQGTVVLRGPMSTFSRFDALADNRGRFELFEGRAFTTTGNFTNSGHVVVGAGSTLTVTGEFMLRGVGSSIQVDGMLVLRGNGSTVTDGGALSGSSRITGPITVANGGIVSPGKSPGTLTIDDFTLGNGGIYRWELDDTGAYDRVDVFDALSFGSNMTLQLVDLGGMPQAATDYVLFTYPATVADPPAAVWTFDTSLAPQWDASAASVVVDALANRVVLRGLTSQTNLPGDINLDGTVNRLDAALFAQYFGTPIASTWTTGDFNFDGATTLADLAMLQSHMGQFVTPSASSPAAAVPEPSSAALSLCGLFACAFSFARFTRRRAKQAR